MTLEQIKQERQAFEDFMRSQNNGDRLELDADGSYADISIEYAWSGWRERASKEAESADNSSPYKPVAENTEPELATLKALEEQIEATVKMLQDSGKYDARSLAVAKTQLETGLLWLNHAIQKQ